MAAIGKQLLQATLRTSRQWNLMQISALNQTVTVRHANFLSSPEVRPLEEYPEVEVIHNPPEWKYVESLLPQPTIPKPTAEKDEFPSGWKPADTAKAVADKLGYLVARTKNYMIPVYLHTRYRGERRITVVRRVQGDIWALEKDLRAVVEKARNGRKCATRVNEMSGQVHIHGDYVDVIREHLKQQGF